MTKSVKMANFVDHTTWRNGHIYVFGQDIILLFSKLKMKLSVVEIRYGNFILILNSRTYSAVCKPQLIVSLVVKESVIVYWCVYNLMYTAIGVLALYSSWSCLAAVKTAKCGSTLRKLPLPN